MLWGLKLCMWNPYSGLDNPEYTIRLITINFELYSFEINKETVKDSIMLNIILLFHINAYYIVVVLP
ncbi:hypothetical protein [Plasmodium yoelii yoelii]|uniref:Uncharacterized protein n=1 Tax=Plasmodium yoelii yoelii TaxID=73239 RepID=Q7RCS5_PLAYO|nr:hypothetical protein [Plasmodium yoelii yoelii]